MPETLTNPSPNPNPSSMFIDEPGTAVTAAAAAMEAEDGERNPYPYRFQRTDQWKPVYKWLESLDADEVVTPADVAAWLAAQPAAASTLLARHSRYHLTHYVQRLHVKLLKKRGKIPKLGVHVSAKKALVNAFRSRMLTQTAPLPCKFSGNLTKDNQIFAYKRNEALLRYEILTDLQKQLTNVLSKHKHLTDLREPHSQSLYKQKSENRTTDQSCETVKNENTGTLSGDASHSQDVVSIHVAEHTKSRSLLEIKGGQKRKRNSSIAIPAWSFNEALFGISGTNYFLSSHCEEGRHSVGKGDVLSSSLPKVSSRKNIVMCLQGREKGVSWPMACSRSGYVGRHNEKWIPFFEGWRSLGRQFEGPAVWFERRNYSSWIPAWCAYTSSAAVAQPHGRQGVQKVLDVKFHPEGLPQLICSSNEAPNELLLYNLLSGRAVPLNGHNCQIQAVEFAVKGASVVSCGANLLKVWDCITGSCLFTLGSVSNDRASAGHSKKINAMTVNSWQSCLVATSGGTGDGKLLLWNALRGELTADLNMNSRTKDQLIFSIDAMEFCSENLLACGSDCSYGGAAVVQLWDIESPQSCQSFPANDSYITSLKSDPACNTIITGAGDGTVGLFDIRTCGAINYLSVGPNCEVTSVSFSSCGIYFSASSTSNSTLVWDTRLMPMNRRQMPLEKSFQGSNLHFNRALHCLSHGKQMPTAEHAGQLPGHVDEGDQGVNDARWLEKEPVLVTVSGDGSIAMWDVTLGQPCVRHLVSHSRCANTIAVAPNDDYLCSGGDDQKVVLYHNMKGNTKLNWRLSHPLTEE